MDTIILLRAATAPRHLRRALNRLLMIDTIKRLRRTLTLIQSVREPVTEKGAGPQSVTGIHNTRDIRPTHRRTLVLAVIITEATECMDLRQVNTSISRQRTVYTLVRRIQVFGVLTTRMSALLFRQFQR